MKDMRRAALKVILACHSEEEGHLEVYVFDYKQGSLFAHHDLMLNALPLCVEWLDNGRREGEGEREGGRLRISPSHTHTHTHTSTRAHTCAHTRTRRGCSIR